MKKTTIDYDATQRSPFFHKAEYVTDCCTITEDDGVVFVNGFRVYGYVLGEEHACKTCGHICIYDGDYDHHLCPRCNVWPEKMCDSPTCDYCALERPEKPFPVFGVNDNTYPPRTGLNWLDINFVNLDEITD